MPVEDTVVINISLDAPVISAQGLGTVLVPGFNANFVERLQRFSSAQAILDADVGIADGDYEHEAAGAIFGQSPFRPSVVAVGRMDAFVAQVERVKIDAAVNAYQYLVTIDGEDEGDYTATVPPDAVGDIRDELVTDINAAGIGLTAAPIAADELDITADVPGRAFTIAVSGANMTLTPQSTNNGYFQELGDIQAEDNDWYGLVTGAALPGPIRQVGHALEAARFIAASRKIYGTQSADSDVKGSAITDLFTRLKDLDRRRTFGLWHDDDFEMGAEALFGAKLSVNPDQRTTTWAHATLAGVTPLGPPDLTVNEQTNIEGKNGNYYGRLGGVGATFPGKLFDGNFIDTLITEDWTFFRMTEDLQNLFLQYSNMGSKIPYTDAGIQIIRSVISNRLRIGTRLGHFAAEPKPFVSDPRRRDISDADVAARLLRLSFGAQLAGAIHTTNIIGNIAINL